MHYDLIIRHAHLHRRPDLVDIAVQGGRFARIANELASDSATREIDAAGRLVSPPFIDAHGTKIDDVCKLVLPPRIALLYESAHVAAL